MADITKLDIDGARAAVWVQDVYNAMDQSNIILTELENECKMNPNEDDTILNGLNDAQDKLSKYYVNLKAAFTRAAETIVNMFQDIENHVENIKGKIEELKGQIFG